MIREERQAIEHMGYKVRIVSGCGGGKRQETVVLVRNNENILS